AAPFSRLVSSPSVGRWSFTHPWIPKAAFVRPDPGPFRVQERNALRNPGFWTLDFGLRKNFPVKGSQRAQLRVEVFNLLNHPNWGLANANPTSGSFGLVTSKSGERQIQLSASYSF